MQEINSLHEIDLKTEGKTAISSQLTDSFRGSRCLNIENRYFIPAATFDRILTADAVRSVVRECGIDTHRQSEVIQIIEDGGRKTLAILLDLRLPELFTQFVEIDQYSTGVDMKLPYDQRTLESILPFNAARKFHDTQWEFIAPRFRKGMGHRKLEFNTILPFIETKRLGEDAFSEVRAVAIHPDHSNFEEASSRTAQYQSGPRMKSGGERLALEESRVALKACKSTFFTHHSDREIHALSILRPVEHPNIVELLGSYSFHDKTNILFPALDGDLAQLLRQNEPPSQFQTVEDFLFGLCGLASAIETLHYYVHDAHGNSIVVLHRNITPSNILIDRNKLVLAGFGCAEFASDEGDSTERGRADMSSIYRPPEENQELFDDPPSHGFSQGSRSSDIWSFGCLMAEVATYVLADRAEGVLKFQECRIITIANEWKVDMFHSGSSENPGVTSWLAKLRENSSNIGTELVRLITEMLQFEPRMRPNAKKVTHRLRILALSSRTKKVYESYGKVAVGPDANEILAERSKFKHLSSAAGLVDLPLIIMPLFESRSRFTHWADLLLRISDQLTTIQESKPFPSRVSVLRSLNSDLLSLLPLATQERIDSDFRNIVQSEVHDLQMSQKLDESRTTQSSGTSYSQGDSQYEGHSAAASSLTLDENIDRQVSLGSVDPDDGIVSVISDKDDINSQISSRKTPPEVVAEDHLAMLLARNESLIPLYEEAFSKVGRRRFIQNFRRLLKRWYLDLLPYRNDNLKHATVYILKSRRIRTKIAQRIIDVHTPQSDEVRAQTENLNVEIQGKTSFLENWIASNEGFVNAGLDSGSLVSQPPTTISQEPLVVETEQEQYAYVSSDGSDDGDSVEEDAYERKDTEYIRGMERFLTEGKAFQKLVLNLQISLLPVSLHSLITSILSIPNEDIWISSMQDHSTINKMKISIEQITREDWNWWPLRPKMRDLEDDETRVHWVCHCKKHLWAEVSKIHVKGIRNILRHRGSDHQWDHLCRTRRQMNRSSWTSVVGGTKEAAGTAINHNIWYGESTATSSSQTRQPNSRGQNIPSELQRMRPLQKPATPQQQVPQGGITMPPTDESRVLFGVQGPRRTLELAQIDALEHNQDKAFFAQVRQEYKKRRGLLRYWFSIWRFNHCIFVEFLKYRPNRVVQLEKSLPTDDIYVYNPRPPMAQLPHIDPHFFEEALYSCSSQCIISRLHDCREPPDGRVLLDRMPKRKMALELEKGGEEHAWGLQAHHKISLVFLSCYFLLLVAGTIVFWVWWLSKHSGDLQNAAVPFTAVTLVLSLILSSVSVLAFSVGQHD